jgi:hypothetical protein
MRVRADGTFGSLFVDKSRILLPDSWLRARLRLKPRTLAHRPGWHAAKTGIFPHMSRRGRVVVVVELRGDIKQHVRPASQGGLWYTASTMRIVGYAE